jgi:prepilin-type N-terminal cleavage/methylation domain-containing protein
MLNAKLKLPAKRQRVSAFSLQPSAFASSAFTLIEMLVVISILAVLAALTVPALKNLGKSDAAISASQQLLDGIGRARQLAMSDHTTVYMVFVPANFWMVNGQFPNPWWQRLTSPQQTVVTNLCGDQLTGYTFVSLQTPGDQPGRHTPHYLAPWRNLPGGTFIAQQKFQAPSSPPFYISAYNPAQPIYGFNVTTSIPFPSASPAPPLLVSLPYVAFNYLGQLTADGQNLAPRDEFIPLARGSVLPAMDVATKAIVLKAAPAGSPSILENPPGNSTNSAYNIIHVERLTGHATLEFEKVQ